MPLILLREMPSNIKYTGKCKIMDNAQTKVRSWTEHRQWTDRAQAKVRAWIEHRQRRDNGQRTGKGKIRDRAEANVR